MMPRIPALLIAGLGTGAAMWLQSYVRELWQIRSLPERVMEWTLLFIPLDVFERGIQQFGPSAKELALTGNIAGMAATLVVLGYLLLRRGASGLTVLGVSLGLWLLAMAVVMPVTGGGFFGTDLFQSPALVNAAYLAVTLLFGVVLLGGAALFRSLDAVRVDTEQGRDARVETRRSFFGAVASLIGVWAGALWLGRDGGAKSSNLELAQVTPPTSVPATPVPPAVGAAAPPPPTAAPPTLEPLPVPSSTRGLERDKDGAMTAAVRPKGTLPDLVPPTEQHYVVTKNAAADPVVDPGSWRLIIDGEVERPVQLDYRGLRQLPAVEIVKTIECISNFTAMCELTSFGCDLISTARWKGVRLVDVINLAGGLKPSARFLSVVSLDEFSAGLPIEVVKDPDTLVVYEMNGQVLPREHGYPARLLVPGRYGMKNPKWLAAIRPVANEYQGWYEQRNWSKEGFVKTMSRIDVPAGGATVPAGSQRIAGIAYAGSRGIKQVELSIDNGATWRTTRFLEEAPGRDVWMRWEATVPLPPGSHSLIVRATDGTGEVQTEEFKLPQPDGGSGRHSISLTSA